MPCCIITWENMSGDEEKEEWAVLLLLQGQSTRGRVVKGCDDDKRWDVTNRWVAVCLGFYCKEEQGCLEGHCIDFLSVGYITSRGWGGGLRGLVLNLHNIFWGNVVLFSRKVPLWAEVENGLVILDNGQIRVGILVMSCSTGSRSLSRFLSDGIYKRHWRRK